MTDPGIELPDWMLPIRDGALTITDFQGGAGVGDNVQLVGFGITGFTALQGGLAQSGSDAVLTLGGGDSITFKNADDLRRITHAIGGYHED